MGTAATRGTRASVGNAATWTVTGPLTDTSETEKRAGFPSVMESRPRKVLQDPSMGCLLNRILGAQGLGMAGST